MELFTGWGLGSSTLRASKAQVCNLQLKAKNHHTASVIPAKQLSNQSALINSIFLTMTAAKRKFHLQIISFLLLTQPSRLTIHNSASHCHNPSSCNFSCLNHSLCLPHHFRNPEPYSNLMSSDAWTYSFSNQKQTLKSIAVMLSNSTLKTIISQIIVELSWGGEAALQNVETCSSPSKRNKQ